MAEQLYGWIFVPLLVVLFVGVNYLKDAWQMIRTTPQASKELNERLLVYHPPLNRTISGEPFNDVNSHLFEALKAGYITLDSDTVKDFVLVTAVSSNRFMQLPALVESVQNFLPNYTLIVYDIGLTATEASLVKEWCQVEYLTSSLFDLYPPHVKILTSYAFKPLLIAEVMRHPRVNGVFWVDSSVRFISSNLSLLQERALQYGFVAFEGTSHSIYAVTPPEMYSYLPLRKNPKKTENTMATLILLYKTPNVVDNFMTWWVACALSKKCIWTNLNRDCDFGQDPWSRYAGCSRYDQSALSILLNNMTPDLRKVALRITKGRHPLLSIMRKNQKAYPKVCS